MPDIMLVGSEKDGSAALFNPSEAVRHWHTLTYNLDPEQSIIVWSFAEEGLYQLCNGRWLSLYYKWQSLTLLYEELSPVEAVAWLVGSGYGDMPPELAQVAESIRLDRLADDAGGPQACAIVPTEGVPPGQNEWRSAEDCLVLPCPVTRTEADQVFRLNRKDKKLSPGRARGMHALIDAYPSEVPPNDLGESVARELRSFPIEDPEWAPYLLTPSGTRPHATRSTSRKGFGLHNPGAVE